MLRTTPQKRYAVCVENDGYAASLELRKIYEIIPDAAATRADLVRVVDESGEDYLYPARYFAAIRLSAQIARTFAAHHAPGQA